MNLTIYELERELEDVTVHLLKNLENGVDRLTIGTKRLFFSCTVAFSAFLFSSIFSFF